MLIKKKREKGEVIFYRGPYEPNALYFKPFKDLKEEEKSMDWDQVFKSKAKDPTQSQGDSHEK